jgi:hypothetical protein
MRDDVKRARLLERKKEDLVYLDLEFNVLKNELTVRHNKKIKKEYVIREYYNLSVIS